MLGPLDVAPTDPNPPLEAKLANPPEVPGEDVAALPKTFPGVAPALAKPDWPKDGVAAEVDAAAHGDAFAPIPMPIDDDCPKAGAADGVPKAGAPKAGAATAGFGALAKALEPNDGVVAEAVAQGDDLTPRLDVPKAGAAVAKAGAMLLAVENAVGRALVVLAG